MQQLKGTTSNKRRLLCQSIEWRWYEQQHHHQQEQQKLLYNKKYGQKSKRIIVLLSTSLFLLSSSQYYYTNNGSSNRKKGIIILFNPIDAFTTPTCSTIYQNQNQHQQNLILNNCDTHRTETVTTKGYMTFLQSRPVLYTSRTRRDAIAKIDSSSFKETSTLASIDTTKSTERINNKRSTTTSSSSTLSYEQQIVRLGRQRKTDAAIQLFQSITTTSPTIRQINAVIDACARAQPVRLDTAFHILRTYCQSKTSSFTSLTSLTSSNDSTSSVDYDQSSFHTIGSVSPTTTSSITTTRKLQANVYTFGALMNAISNSGNVQLAVQYVTETMEVEYGVKPNTVVYNAAISACAKSDPPRPDIAIQLLDHAKDKNIPLTVNGYNAACAASASAANWHLAASILRRMNNTNNNNTNLKGIKVPLPDSITYGTVMSACEKCNEWDQCLFYFDTMINVAKLQPDRLSLTSALHACQQLGLAQRALSYLHMMQQQQDELDQHQHQHNTNDKNNNHRRQSEWTQQQQQQQCQRVGPDAVAYRLAISACARGKAWKDAINVLDIYIQDSNQYQPEQDVVAFTAAIHACEHAGAWKYSFILVDKLRKSGAIPNEVTYAAVIGSCATACAQLQQQQQYQQSQQSQQQSQQQSNLNKFTSSTLSSPEIPISNLPEPQIKALQLLSVLRKDPTVPSPTIQVYNAAIRVCAEAYDINRAFKIFDIIEKDNIQPTIVTYGTLMTACERVGSVKGMDKVFQLLRRKYDDNDTNNNNIVQVNEIIYGAAISICRKTGESERAFKLLTKMINDGLHPNIATFNTALSAQFGDTTTNNNNRNNIDRAMQIYQLLQSRRRQQGEQKLQNPKQQQQKDDEVIPNRQTFTLFVRGFNMNRQPQQAEMMLRLMKDNGYQPDVDLYTATISEYERDGKPLLALRLMESMRTDGYDFYESSVLNNLFKKAVKLASAVGRTWSPSNSTSTVLFPSSNNDEYYDDYDYDDE